MVINTEKWEVTSINVTPYFQAVNTGDTVYQKKYLDNLLETYGYTNFFMLIDFIRNHKKNELNIVYIISKPKEVIKEGY